MTAAGRKAAPYPEVEVGSSQTQTWVAVVVAAEECSGHNRVLGECVREVSQHLDHTACCSRPMGHPTPEMEVPGWSSMIARQAASGR